MASDFCVVLLRRRQKQQAVFGTAVATCHPEQARNRTAVAPNTTTSPRASKFCFLKLPIVFGYAVPFTAISKKQNRKGSPTSLIYPLKGKLTSFVIKQFFAFSRVHQTLMRSRLRRFCSIHSVPSAKLRRVRKKFSIIAITTTFRTCSG